MRRILIALLLVLSITSDAQLPGFDIYIMDLNKTGNTAKPANITNHSGYDNQPSFSADGKYIYYAAFYDTLQSDIYSYSIKKKTTTRLTNTSESEFSPEMTPDKKHISVVRVEKDSSQRFCTYDLKNMHAELFLDSVKLIGYYGRLDKEWLAMFLLPEPFTLAIANLSNGYQIAIDQSIGRCIKKIPGQAKFSYITKPNDSVWVLNEAHIYQAVYEAGDLTEISKIPSVSEDYVWAPDGSRIYMARNNAIYYFDYTGDHQWHLHADLSTYGIKKIYRLAINPAGNQLAFVAEE